MFVLWIVSCLDLFVFVYLKLEFWNEMWCFVVANMVLEMGEKWCFLMLKNEVEEGSMRMNKICFF